MEQIKEIILSDNDTPECVICLDTFTTIYTTLDCCSHQFHENCIKKWSEMTNLCPLCKRRFNSIKICNMNEQNTRVNK
jgi:hypothetical protein